MAVVVATGIAADGTREVLGLDVGDSEDETFWRGFLLSLKQRGLARVPLVISDQHSGLVAGAEAVLPGRRTPALPGPLRPQPARARPKSHADMVAAVFRTIFAQPDPEAVSPGTRSATSSPPRSRRSGRSWTTRRPRSPRSRPSRRPTGARSGRPTRSSGSTRRSSAVPPRRDLPQPAAVIRLVGAVPIDMYVDGIAVIAVTSEESMVRLYGQQRRAVAHRGARS